MFHFFPSQEPPHCQQGAWCVGALEITSTTHSRSQEGHCKVFALWSTTNRHGNRLNPLYCRRSSGICMSWCCAIAHVRCGNATCGAPVCSQALGSKVCAQKLCPPHCGASSRYKAARKILRLRVYCARASVLCSCKEAQTVCTPDLQGAGLPGGCWLRFGLGFSLQIRVLICRGCPGWVLDG